MYPQKVQYITEFDYNANATTNSNNKKPTKSNLKGWLKLVTVRKTSRSSFNKRNLLNGAI